MSSSESVVDRDFYPSLIGMNIEAARKLIISIYPERYVEVVKFDSKIEHDIDDSRIGLDEINSLLSLFFELLWNLFKKPRV